LQQVVATDQLLQQLAVEIQEKTAQTTSSTELSKHLLAWLQTKPFPPLQEKKISSKNETLSILLEKAPKVIQMIKQWQPETLLFGFKLLVDASTEELLEVGWQLLQKNQCDYVLANDLQTIHGSKHRGLLIDRTKSYTQYETKAAIATAICSTILQEKEKKR